MDEKKLNDLRYLTLFPADFDENKKYPVILYLHGSGTRNKMEALHTNPLFRELKKQNQPVVAIAPLCEENSWFDHFHDLKALVRHITTLLYVDAERFYLTGLSMGGYGAWQLAMSIPEYFAALVPVCGGGMYWSAGRLQNLPVWAFHGGKDPTVLPEESEKMVAKVNAKGGNAKLTVFPENGHNAWDDTYSNPALFEWLLSHKKGAANLSADEFNNAKTYG